MPSRIYKRAKPNTEELQTEVRDAKQHQREIGIDYDAAHARQAAVHTREDVVLSPIIRYVAVEKDSIDLRPVQRVLPRPPRHQLCDAVGRRPCLEGRR